MHNNASAWKECLRGIFLPIHQILEEKEEVEDEYTDMIQDIAEICIESIQKWDSQTDKENTEQHVDHFFTQASEIMRKHKDTVWKLWYTKKQARQNKKKSCFRNFTPKVVFTHTYIPEPVK